MPQPQTETLWPWTGSNHATAAFDIDDLDRQDGGVLSSPEMAAPAESHAVILLTTVYVEA